MLYALLFFNCFLLVLAARPKLVVAICMFRLFFGSVCIVFDCFSIVGTSNCYMHVFVFVCRAAFTHWCGRWIAVSCYMHGIIFVAWSLISHAWLLDGTRPAIESCKQINASSHQHRWDQWNLYPNPLLDTSTCQSVKTSSHIFIKANTRTIHWHDLGE